MLKSNLKDISKIMVVDDEAGLVKMISRFLEAEGYFILTAHSGEQALEVFKETPCDLVVTDIKMPGMGGIELLRQIKKLDKYVEVIVLTGFGSLDNAVQAFRDDGAFDYFCKPLNDMGKFIVTIGQALAKRRLNLKNWELVKDIMRKKTLARTAIDSISDTIIMLNSKKIIIGLNKAALVYFGLKKFNECIGKVCYKVFAKTDSVCDRCQIIEHLQTRETIEFEQKGIYKPDRIENISIYPLKNSDIDLEQGVLVKIQDITQKVKIEDQMELTDRLAALGILSAGISHEIRNPLHAIRLFTDILEKKQSLPRSHEEIEILDEIKNGIHRIDRIINQTLNFSRSSETIMERIQINDLIQENLKSWSSKFSSSSLQVDFCPGKNLPSITGDRMSLLQVLNNLISNAGDSMGKKGTISISTYSKTSSFYNERLSIYIQIKDTGPGIKKSDLGKIFNPFFSTKATGTGLGLPITHKIIKKHGGHITVKSEPDLGAAFTIELPALPEQRDDKALFQKQECKNYP